MPPADPASSPASSPGSRRVARRPDALWRSTPEAVLVLGRGDEVIRLTGGGRLLWLLLDRPATVAELERDIAASFDDAEGAPSTLVGLAGHVDELVRGGLLVDVR